MRAFIGLDFDVGLKKELCEIQKILKLSSKKGSWVPQPNFHITLKFLGNIDEDKVGCIDKAIKYVAYSNSPISLILGELGYFNKKGEEYGVLWLGIKGAVEKLHRVYDMMERKMNEIGFVMEKREFTPHITLGRKVKSNIPFNELSESIEHKLGRSFTLHNIALMKSHEVMGKRVYTPIKYHEFVRC